MMDGREVDNHCHRLLTFNLQSSGLEHGTLNQLSIVCRTRKNCSSLLNRRETTIAFSSGSSVPITLNIAGTTLLGNLRFFRQNLYFIDCYFCESQLCLNAVCLKCFEFYKKSSNIHIFAYCYK